MLSVSFGTPSGVYAYRCAIRRPARASGVLGPEQSTGLFSPCGFEPLMLDIRNNKTDAVWRLLCYWYTIRGSNPGHPD